MREPHRDHLRLIHILEECMTQIVVTLEEGSNSNIDHLQDWGA